MIVLADVYAVRFFAEETALPVEALNIAEHSWNLNCVDWETCFFEVVAFAVMSNV